MSYPVCAGVQSLSHFWLYDPMDCLTPGFPVLHHLSEFAHSCPLVSDAIQPSHSLSPLFPPALNLPASGSLSVSQLFALGGQSVRTSTSSSVLPVNVQSWFLVGLTGLISLLSKGLSRVFPSTTGQKPQFFGTQPACWNEPMAEDAAISGKRRQRSREVGLRWGTGCCLSHPLHPLLAWLEEWMWRCHITSFSIYWKNVKAPM